MALRGLRMRALANSDLLNVEEDVNGAWNSILAGMFPPGDLRFTISPEAHPAPGFEDRMALYVRRCDYNAAHNIANPTPILVYQGKGAAGDIWDMIQAQLLINLVAIAVPGNGRCWAIGARGNCVRVWKFHRNTGLMLPWGVVGNAAVELLPGQGHSGPWNVTADWININVLLTHLQRMPV